MAKKDKKANKTTEEVVVATKAEVISNNGMKCYKKIGGGSHRFPNRIIKPGQNFWINPNLIPKGIADVFQEIPADSKAVIVSTESIVMPVKGEKVNVSEKFEMVEAKDENGEVVKKGESVLYNVVDADGKAVNEKPLREAKAKELLETLNL